MEGAAERASLVLSILAGVRIRTLADALGNLSVVRAMPNTPAQIGQGITVWTATRHVPEEQRDQARALLGALGEEICVDDEKYLDMATALSGSGPSYVFLLMEALIDVGVHMGFSRRDAERLVLQTLKGSAEYAMQSNAHPAALRNQVTSPGGTSAAALYELEKGRIRTVIGRAGGYAGRQGASLALCAGCASLIVRVCKNGRASVATGDEHERYLSERPKLDRCGASSGCARCMQTQRAGGTLRQWRSM
jgi:pyrroline-5-carboxylate reductase